MLLSGENNHDWERSAPYCKALLEESGRFAVDLSLRPEDALADEETLAGYDLLFVDYNGTAWGEKAQANFERAVGGGTGLVVLHAANNAFPDWPAYQRMLGLSFQEEQSGHGDFHEFEVRIEDAGHPAVSGLADFVTCDELYHGMVPVRARLIRYWLQHTRIPLSAGPDGASRSCLPFNTGGAACSTCCWVMSGRMTSMPATAGISWLPWRMRGSGPA
ncbi:hypothetical protein COHCIP112018_05007 [Cohnella sp. JJ-181]|nr:hypothetical protein COHCIP112018_05007 [Cohnella sp. JJ-181]